MKKLKTIQILILGVYTRLVKRIYRMLHANKATKKIVLTFIENRSSRLTPREREIIILLVAGLNNHQIADKLNISWNTEENHHQNIYKKTDCHTITELSKYAIENGIVAIKKGE